jgi:hypothetical protein
MMGLFNGIIVFLLVIAIITLFVISSSLASISSNIRIIRKLLSDWKKESGSGAQFTCNKCHNKYEGKQLFCPHCGAAIPYQ